MERRIGYITDVEGNFDYWVRCVELSRAVCFDDKGQLQFRRDDSFGDQFVYGGDAFDNGPGDIRLARSLVNFKERHPNRVHLLAGNRDINKLRFAAELQESSIDVPYPVPVYPRSPPQESYREFLARRAQAAGKANAEDVDSRANRVQWMLGQTMTAAKAFEHRRVEMQLIQDQECKNAGRSELNQHGKETDSGEQKFCVDDKAVADGFLESVIQPDGLVWRYLECSQLAKLIGDTLFVHAGLPAGALGWIPSQDMSYQAFCGGLQGDVCRGRTLQNDHTAQDWVDEMNSFYCQGLEQFRQQMVWRQDRSRGGEPLLCMTSTPACFNRSIVVESLLQMGMPQEICPAVEEYLVGRGVHRLVCGHKPCGDSPFVVRGRKIDFVHCDTTYSDDAALDRRGLVVAAVEIVGTDVKNFLHIRGVLQQGEYYDFALVGEQSSDGLPQNAVPNVDDLVGRRTADGWWVKCALPDGSYHLAFASPGDRTVQYRRESLDSVRESVARASPAPEENSICCG